MRNHPMMRIAAVAAVLAVHPVAASAQQPCPEGPSMSGDCLNPELGQAMRQGVIVYTQPKLSHTSPPVPPSGDIGQAPRDPHETSTLFSAPIPTGRPCVRAGCP